MEGAAKFYLACLGLAVLFFAMFPAHDTIVNPVKVMPLETRVERVIEGGPDVTTINQQIEVSMREIVDLESRVEAVEDADDAWRADADRRIRNATDYAVSAVTEADTLWAKVAAVEEEQTDERKSRSQVDILLTVLCGVGTSLAVIALIELYKCKRSRRCNKTTSGTPTSAGTPTKR